MTGVMRVISNPIGVVIHHSASGDVSTNTIDRWHRQRGFAEVGYHFVIRHNGDIEMARSWERAGAHARTGAAVSRNATHWGICLTGHFGKHPPTIEQMDSLLRLCRGLRSRMGINVWERHHEECPGQHFPWEYFYLTVKRGA